MGCWAIGCAGIVVLFLTLCGGGFYGVFYSSLPLKLIEAALEEDGEIEIEGLKGNLVSGFTADEVRFKADNDQWSNLTDIKFKYSGGSSIFGSDRLIIEELSINGGTIYADWDPETSEFDFDSDIASEFDELGDEFDEFGDEMRDEFGQSPAIREIRIDLVRVANLKIVNPTTQLEITLDEIKFDGFQMLKGELVSMGELFIKSSQVDLVSVPSVEFADMKNSQRFEGTLRAQVDHRLTEDMPFVVDFAIDDELRLLLKANTFNDKLQFVQTPDDKSLSYNEFSPVDFIDLKTGQLQPSEVNLRLEYGEKTGEGPINVNSDGSFMFGKNRFTDLRIEEPGKGRDARLVGTGTVNGETVQAKIRILSPFSPIFDSWLESETFESAEELWSQTVFGKSFDELTEEEQSAVNASQIVEEPDAPEMPEMPEVPALPEVSAPSNDEEDREAPEPAEGDSEKSADEQAESDEINGNQAA